MTPPRPPKRRPVGINLPELVWDLLDETTPLAGVPRNHLFEHIIMERYGVAIPDTVNRAIDEVARRHAQ